MSDYTATARRYESDVLDGTIPACKWVRLAVERNRRDLARQSSTDFSYHYDTARAASICQAVELMPHVEGPEARVVGEDDEGRPVWNPIALQPWQVWLYTTAFGWVRDDDGTRRFRTALAFVPRKNGKSTLSSGVANYLLTADGESGARVYSAATTRDQARIVFATAKEMAKRSPAFRDYFGLQVKAHELVVPETNSTFRALSADADTLDGLNISGAIVDEIHAHRTRHVWDVLETATGARRQPLIWGITTAGTDIAGICYELLQYLRKILEQSLADESFFGVEHTIDEGDDWTSPDAHRKANPNYGVSVAPDDLARKVTKAKASPAAVNNFLTKHLNVWVKSEASWMPMDAWHACADPTLTLDALTTAPCWIGVDLAEVRDVAAVVAVCQLPKGKTAAIGRFYLPADTIAHAPVSQYAGWVRSGYLLPTDGGATDYQRIEDDIAAWCATLAVKEVCFDRALAAHMAQRLMARLGPKIPVVTVNQSVDVMNPAMQWLEQAVVDRRFAHAADPVLTWMASNVVVQRNHKGEVYPRKAGGKDSHNKIDGIVALLTAASRVMAQPEARPIAAVVRVMTW